MLFRSDFSFARKLGLEIIPVVSEDGSVYTADEMTEAYVGKGKLINSAQFDGMDNEEAKTAIVEYLAKDGNGETKVNFRLRDWLISRQRFWGAPIPIVYCEHCGAVPVPEEQLPVMLPSDIEFKPNGESPLKYMDEFVNTTCPICGRPARRESDTMDTFVCSSW